MFGSLTAGLVADLLLIAAPFVADEEPAITGTVLCGFALGWAMLAVLGSAVDSVLKLAVAARLVGARGLDGGAGSHLRSRSRRWLLSPVIGMLALAAVGGGYETVSAATDAPLALPGQSIDVGGHSLHLHCTGTGSPTVVLQPGGGALSADMGWIAPRVAAEPACVSTTARVEGEQRPLVAHAALLAGFRCRPRRSELPGEMSPARLRCPNRSPRSGAISAYGRNAPYGGAAVHGSGGQG